MTFQIEALPMAAFAQLFELSETELAGANARRVVATCNPGFPCRVSLRDAEVGETLLLVNYTHQPANSPYRATHAVFVRENATQAKPALKEVPEVLQSRLLSIRFFDGAHMMIGAEVCDGRDAASVITQGFERAEVAYAHIHNAKPGCFAAAVRRASEQPGDHCNA